MNLTRKTCLLLITAAMYCSFDSHAQSSNLTLDRSAAMANARSVDTQLTINQLTEPGTLNDGMGTVEKLRTLSQRDDWPLPARELAIYQFTRSLAALTRHEVDPAILDYLTLYQPQVWVSSDEHAQDLIPLFNIRAAAAGIKNNWLRQDSKLLATQVINTHPSEFVALFIQAQDRQAQDKVVRAGYLDALRQADSDSVQAIGAQAFEQLRSIPELSALLAVVAQADKNGDTIQRLLVDGKGPQIAPVLRSIAQQLNRDQLAKLLQFAVAKAPAENAALAIASWWPELSSDPATRQLLLNTLAYPELGSAAALALADKPNVQTIHELQQLAEGDSLAAKRARIALDIDRQNLIREQLQ